MNSHRPQETANRAREKRGTKERPPGPHAHDMGAGKAEKEQSHGCKLPRTMENGTLHIQGAHGLLAACAHTDPRTARRCRP